MVEFLPYFQGRGHNPAESYVNYVFPIQERRKWMREFNEEIRRQADGQEPVTALIRDTKPDLVIRLAGSVLEDAGETHFVNFPNRGNITNLPDGAMVELPARIFSRRYEGEMFGEMPPVLRSWLLRVVDVQELTLEAAMTGNRRTLFRPWRPIPSPFPSRMPGISWTICSGRKRTICRRSGDSRRDPNTKNVAQPLSGGTDES